MNESLNIQLIDTFDTDELRMYTLSSEVRLYHYFEPEPGVFIAESGMVVNRALSCGYEPMSFLVDTDCILPEVIDILHANPLVPVYGAPHVLLKELTGYNITRGLLSCMRRKALPAATDIIKNTLNKPISRIAVLEDVENPTNIGAIFRSAAALNMDAVILTGGGCDPLYRRSIRVSVGTIFQVPWTIIPKPDDCLNLLREHGYKTAAMSLSDHTIPISDKSLHNIDRLAIVLGNEGYGLSTQTIDTCDFNVMIPMAAGIDSLNVAAASAVAFWELHGHR